MLNEGESHRVPGRLIVFLVVAWHEVSLQLHFVVEVVFVVAKPGGLLEGVPFLGSAAVATEGPPFGLGSRLSCSSSLHPASSLSGDSHWMTLWLGVLIVHTWHEIALLHFLVEFFLAVAESGGLLNVIPLF